MIALAIAAGMATISVLLHFEAILFIERLAGRIKQPRKALITIWSGLLAAHAVEVWLYAGAYWLCTRLGIGSLSGIVHEFDYIYFSAVVYSTLGFGDIIPNQALRMVAGTEAVVGLCLIAWSATATYSFTQRHIGRLSRPPSV